MTETKSTVLLLMLMVTIILLMIAIGGLFLRMNQLQGQVLAVLQATLQGAPGVATGLRPGTPAPNFSLPEVTSQVVVNLSDFARQRVLLAFASPQCSACVKTYPYLKKFSETRPDIRVIMISRGSAEENRQLVEEQSFAFPVLSWDDAVAQAYQVPGTPFFYVLDEGSVIINAGVANTLEQLETLVVSNRERR